MSELQPALQGEAELTDLNEPILTNGADTGSRHQPWCSADVPAGADRCPRCNVWQPRNSGAVQTGIYRQSLPPDVQGPIDRFSAGIVADLGGETELSTLERGRIRRLSGVEGTLLQLEADIALRGLLTPAGGVRKVYDDYLRGVQVWDRVASRLPSGRRPRRVPSLDEALAAVDAHTPEDAA